MRKVKRCSAGRARRRFPPDTKGAPKRVYPCPLQDKVTGIREERTFKTVNLENEYIRLSILLQIGGRLFSAIDKTNGYDIVYRQHAIKPALIV